MQPERLRKQQQCNCNFQRHLVVHFVEKLAPARGNKRNKLTSVMYQQDRLRKSSGSTTIKSKGPFFWSYGSLTPENNRGQTMRKLTRGKQSTDCTCWHCAFFVTVILSMFEDEKSTSLSVIHYCAGRLSGCRARALRFAAASRAAAFFAGNTERAHSSNGNSTASHQ